MTERISYHRVPQWMLKENAERAEQKQTKRRIQTRRQATVAAVVAVLAALAFMALPKSNKTEEKIAAPVSTPDDQPAKVKSTMKRTNPANASTPTNPSSSVPVEEQSYYGTTLPEPQMDVPHAQPSVFPETQKNRPLSTPRVKYYQ